MTNFSGIKEQPGPTTKGLIINEENTVVEAGAGGANTIGGGKEWMAALALLTAPWEPNNNSEEGEELPKVQYVEINEGRAVIPGEAQADSKPNDTGN